MQEDLLGRRIAGDVLDHAIELGDAGGIEKAQARIGRRDEEAILDRRADIAGGADRIAALKERCASARIRTRGARLPSCRTFQRSQRLREEILRAEISRLEGQRQRFPSELASAGMPGSISGPMDSDCRPSARTAAPDVSPPATTSRLTPPSTSARAVSANSVSSLCETCSRPNASCDARTLSGLSEE